MKNLLFEMKLSRFPSRFEMSEWDRVQPLSSKKVAPITLKFQLEQNKTGRSQVGAPSNAQKAQSF